MILGGIPSANDCRSLWQELRAHLPKGDYEIVTVDERASGLLFYGAMEVENVTRRRRPYPTFMPPESLEHELEEMRAGRFAHLFLVHGPKHIGEVESALAETAWRVKKTKLRHGRWLLSCSPPDEI